MKTLKGMNQLNPTAQRIIEMKYGKKESWVAISLETKYSQIRCKEIGKETLMIIGEYLYGILIHQDLPLVAGAGCY